MHAIQSWTLTDFRKCLEVSQKWLHRPVTFCTYSVLLGVCILTQIQTLNICLTSDAGEVMRLKYVIQYTGSVFQMQPVGTCCARGHSKGTFTLTAICSDNATLSHSFSVRVGDLSDKSDRDRWRFKKIGQSSTS